MRNKSFNMITVFLLLALLAPSATVTARSIQYQVSANAEYSISGRVTDLSGNPVAGATITAIPCDLRKQPVLLIHGWGGSDEMMEDTGGFAQLYQWMHADGYVQDCNLFYAVGVSQLNTNNQNRQAIQQNLRNAYDQLVVDNPNWRGHFDIIGHSYGGLNSRFYLESGYYQADQNYGQYGIHIDNLFTLGSPHGGVKVPSELYPGAMVIGYSHVLTPKSFLDFLSAAQLYSSAIDVYNNANSQPKNTCYRLLGGDFLPQVGVPLVIRAAYLPWSSYPGDIGISLRSSRQLGVNPSLSPLYPNVEVVTNEDMHGYVPPITIPDIGQIDLSHLNSYVRPEATYQQHIKNYLGASMSQCISSGSAETSDLTAAAANVFTSPVLVASGELTATETLTHTLHVDWSGKSTFYVSWQGGDLSFNMVDPNDTLITPNDALSDPNAYYGKLTFGDTNLVTYVFTDTIPGLWSYSLSSVSGPYPIHYEASANPESVLKVVASVPNQQKLGTSVLITATVEAAAIPIPGAAVTATVTKPDEAIHQLFLLDNGVDPDLIPNDGVYSGSYTETGLGGFYTVLVAADGIYNSTPFFRTTQEVFAITPENARLRQTYEDQGIDTDGNSLFDYLEVQVGVLVTETGNLSLSANLLENGGQHITDANTVMNINSTGVQTITLQFSGEDIWSNAVNGPYRVSQVSLVDDDTFILLDSGDSDHQTSPYDYHQFHIGYPVYLPHVASSGDLESSALNNIDLSLSTASNSTITDSDGYYYFNELPDGTYTLIPSWSGNSFEPKW